jgi:hypothetical protein
MSYRYLFCSYKFYKTENYFIFEMLKKKIWASFQKIVTNEFGIRDPKKTYSGSRIRVQGVTKAPDPGSGSATLVFSEIYNIFVGHLCPSRSGS